MQHLNTEYNQHLIWKDILLDAKRGIEVDLIEIERIIDLARRTPGLAKYENELQQLSIFFRVATMSYQQNNPDGLTDLVAFWERYRDAVIQRYTSVTPVELYAADKVVKDIFQRYLDNVPNINIAYSRDASPLVYGGKGGLKGYFTHPPGWNRPFAIINLPHTAFDNVWHWLALPHETGHDTYASIKGLDSELEDVLETQMQNAVKDGLVNIPDVNLDLNEFGLSHQIRYSGEEFLGKVWRSWANEAQADMVGLLSCGSAAILALQQIIGFEADDIWEIFSTENGIDDAPEVHPTSYVRNALNIEALRIIGQNSIADEVQARFEALRPQKSHITWRLGRTIEVASVPVREMVRSAELAAEIIISSKLTSLGNQSYRDLSDFTSNDQAIVDRMTDLLIEGNPTFAQVDNATPRHALAATIFAFEKDRTKAEIINRTFKHFV
ncbi:MAG: hypothetical protein ACMUJM_14985 [bacterium]